MNSLKQYRSAKLAFPDLLNWAVVVADGIILNKDGSLLTGWKYTGQDLSSVSFAERNYIASIVNSALAQLGSEWVLHQDATRKPVSAYSPLNKSAFNDPITRLIDAERREHFESEDTHFESHYAFYLTYLPAKILSSKMTELMFTDAATVGEKTVADRALQKFKQAINDIEDRLSSVVELSRMTGMPYTSDNGTEHVVDVLLTHLNETLCGDSHPINLPSCPMFIDSIIGGYEFYTGIVPRLGNKYIQTVSIEGFPSESYPGILSALDELPVEYRWNTRFIFLDPIDAQTGLKKYRRQWQQKVRGFMDSIFHQHATTKTQVDQNAMAMVRETDVAMSESSQGLVSYGYYTSVVVLMDDNLQKLDEAARDIKRLINNIGFLARIETVNCIEAFLGSLPGHAVQNIRRPMLHTYHLAHMLPLAATWAGKAVAPCPMYPPKSPALLYASTDGATPFRLNLHIDDLGHTLMFGPPGSGKSTALALIAAQFSRYPNATIFAFDKGNSLEVLTKAVEGDHFNVAGDSDGDNVMSFAPLHALNTVGEISWAQDWVITLLELQNLIILPMHRKEIHRALLALRDSTEPKSITNLGIMIQDTAIKSALDSYTVSGEYGQLLDAESDGLDVGNWACFELEELMERNDRIRLPVLLYLFHVIEKKLLGQPALLILDEAWIMLGHPTFKEKIREWLKTLRKANCVVLLSTQSLSDASSSGILDVLNESCPTKIFLANPQAHEADSHNLYTSLGCNDVEIEIIARLTRKRHYFVKGEGARRIDLTMGPIALAFTGATSKQDLKRVRELNETHGSKWPFFWMNEKGVSYDRFPTN